MPGRSATPSAPASLTVLRKLRLVFSPVVPELMFRFLYLASDDVNHGEHDDPHRVHEMPVERQHVEAVRVLVRHCPRSVNAKRWREDQTYNHMKAMQADQRIVGRSEQVGADGQPVFENQPVPFARRAVKESGAQRDRPEPPVAESSDAALANRSDREVNRQTARKQADRIKDRGPENVSWHRPGEALADVEEVRDHENDEDRGLGGDQSRTFPRVRAREVPREDPLRHRHWCGAHRRRLTTRIASPDPPGV